MPNYKALKLILRAKVAIDLSDDLIYLVLVQQMIEEGRN